MSKKDIPSGERLQERYSYSFKKELVEKIENGKLSQRQASKIYGVDRKTIYVWKKRFSNFDKKLREMGGKSPQESIADLRSKLRVSEGENQVLKAVIEIIGEEYGEEVVKKYLPESLRRTNPTRKTRLK